MTAVANVGNKKANKKANILKETSSDYAMLSKHYAYHMDSVDDIELGSDFSLEFCDDSKHRYII
jgi:hypothetical protein